MVEDFRGCSTRCAARINSSGGSWFGGGFTVPASWACLAGDGSGGRGFGRGGGSGGNFVRLARSSSALQTWLLMAWYEKFEGTIDLCIPPGKKRRASVEW